MKKNPGRKERRRLEHKNRIENGIKLQTMQIIAAICGDTVKKVFRRR